MNIPHLHNNTNNYTHNLLYIAGL